MFVKHPGKQHSEHRHSNSAILDKPFTGMSPTGELLRVSGSSFTAFISGLVNATGPDKL